MAHVKVQAGDRFGRLVVLGDAPRRMHPSGVTERVLECRCDCGRSKSVGLSCLRKGDTRSCGCLQRERSTGRTSFRRAPGSGNYARHGMSKTPEYRSYWKMLDRCYNPDQRRFADYGGRGIEVCDRWLHEGFPAFIEDMGLKPTPRHTIDRVDVDGPYCPENCRWATASEQAQNTRRTRAAA